MDNGKVKFISYPFADVFWRKKWAQHPKFKNYTTLIPISGQILTNKKQAALIREVRVNDFRHVIECVLDDIKGKPRYKALANKLRNALKDEVILPTFIRHKATYTKYIEDRKGSYSVKRESGRGTETAYISIFDIIKYRSFRIAKSIALAGGGATYE